MKSIVVHPDPSTEFYTEERCFILESWNTAEDEELSIARARVQPGVSTVFHAVDATVERYLVFSGEATVEVGTLPPTRIGPGDVVVIAPGTQQRVTNTGTADFVFYALCTPRFQQRVYRPLEST
jgi:mannose-6-phosphate isomerase-like protein (cupin superfamily)